MASQHIYIQIRNTFRTFIQLFLTIRGGRLGTMINLDDADDEYVFERDEEWVMKPEHHHRTIIHIDIDCFYAQVEMIRNPNLRDKPLGVKQKNLMVTSNYVARAAGVPKTCWIKEALSALPNLILVDGSDLTHYRQFSLEISDVLRTFTTKVERLGLDENFIDVSESIDDYVEKFGEDIFEGHLYGDKNEENICKGDLCGCGCFKRLTAAMYIAKEMRQRIFESTGITCCAGVGHNKLLSKLVSGYQKPNNQTLVYPWMTRTVMSSLDSPKNIPGIGSATYKILQLLGVSTLKQLQTCSLSLLNKKIEQETSLRLKKLAFGVDESIVRPSGRPASIGLEDACKKASSISDVKIMFSLLTKRLLKLLANDGRTPATLKVTVRKYDISKRFGQRETKQCPISPTLFPRGVKSLPDVCDQGLITMVMSLFNKMVDANKPFHLTLVGIAFTKFIEVAPDTKSIAHFFTKRKQVVVESQASVEIEPDIKKQKTNYNATCNKEYFKYKNVGHENSGKYRDDYLYSENFSGYEGEESETNIERSISNYSSFESHLCNNSNLEYDENKTQNKEEMLSNAPTNELNTYGLDKTQTSSISISTNIQDLSIASTSTDCLINPNNFSASSFSLPPNVDPEVFRALPGDLQKEILSSLPRDTQSASTVKIKNREHTHQSPMKQENQGIQNFFKISSHSNSKMKENNLENNKINYNSVPNKGISKISNVDKNASSNSCNIKNLLQYETHQEQNLKKSNNLEKDLLQGIDPEVFDSLPREIQLEILQDQKKRSVPIKSKRNSMMSYFKKL
ncbi:unnamed protein product, partial [Meganyctiphanes norvegica]